MKFFLNYLPLFISVVLLSSSCGLNQITDIPSEDKNEYTMKVEDKTLSFEKDNLKDLEGHIKLPNWIKSKSKNSVIKVEAEGNISIIAQLVSDKSIEDTEQYWLEYFEKEEYSNIRNISSNSYHQIYGQKDKDTTLTIAISEFPESQSKSTVNLTYMHKSI